MTLTSPDISETAPKFVHIYISKPENKAVCKKSLSKSLYIE